MSTLQLRKYNDQIKEKTIERIAQFFGFHSSLVHSAKEMDTSNFETAEATLSDWLTLPSELYTFYSDEQSVGFIRIAYRGANVAWIEDIFVDPVWRNKGIASQAIFLVEELIRKNPQYTAVCLDVVPRNAAALKLYHKLGYDNLSLITVRKELYNNDRDRKTDIFDLKFRY